MHVSAYVSFCNVRDMPPPVGGGGGGGEMERRVLNS